MGDKIKKVKPIENNRINHKCLNNFLEVSGN